MSEIRFFNEKIKECYLKLEKETNTHKINLLNKMILRFKEMINNL